MGRKLMRVVVLGLALLIMTSLLTPGAFGAEEPSIREYYYVKPTSIAIYDIDNDTKDEILLQPSHIIDNFLLIRSRYSQPKVFTYDDDGDGHLDIAFYDDNHTLTVYNVKKNLVLRFHVPKANVIPALNKLAVAIGNTIIYHGEKYEVGGIPSDSKVIPVPYGSEIWAIYNGQGHLIAKDLSSGTTYTIWNSPLDVVGAFKRGEYFYVLAREGGGTLFIVYDTYQEFPEFVGYTVSILGVITFKEDSFYAYSENKIYKISFDGLLVEAEGRYLDFDGHYIYIYNDRKVILYSTRFEEKIKELPLPFSSKPNLFAGKYPYLVMNYGGITYVYYDRPKPHAIYLGRKQCYVGNKLHLSIATPNAKAYTVLVDGEKIRGDYVVFEKAGNHTLKIYATNGIVTTSTKEVITALPRPLGIGIKVQKPALYNFTQIEIVTTDLLNNSKVSLVCNLTIYNKTRRILSLKPVTVFLKPINYSSLRIPVVVECGNEKYEHKKITFNITATPIKPTIIINYLGEGKLSVNLSSPAEIPVTGKLTILVNGQLVAKNVSIPANITINKGNNSVIIFYHPGLPIFAPAKYKFNVQYFTSTTPIKEKSVMVADVVKIINNTIIKNQTIPVEIVRVKREADLRFTVLSMVVGIVVGVGLSLVRPKLQRRGENGDVEEVNIEET